MSDFDYRHEDDNEESINESDIRIENTPVKAGSGTLEQSDYQDTSYGRQTEGGNYYGNPGQTDSGYGSGYHVDGTYGSRYQGDSTYGNRYQGDGTYESRYQGDGTYESHYQGDGTYGNRNQGDGTYGNRYQGDSTYGNRYQGDGTYESRYQGDSGSSNRFGDSSQSMAGNSTKKSHIPDEPDRSGKKKKEKKSSWFSGALKAASFALIFGLVSGATFAGVNSAKENFFPSTSAQIETNDAESKVKDNADDKDNKNSKDSKDSAAADNAASSAIPKDASAVVDEVMPSVVSITGTYRTENYFGFGSQESEGAGSGFLIAENDDKYFLATNNHVVEYSSSLTVGFIDDTTAPATVVGKDSNVDVAVISVNKKDVSKDTAKKIKIATLGSSDDLKLGQPVIVIGNALGYGQSVTYGVLSAKDREISFADGTMSLLQTDAAINPGNSGGVMINLKGEVVGISNAKLEDTSIEGMCYAVPISTAKVIMTDLMNAGEISKEDASYLGIVGKNIDASYSEALGMPKGIYISQVVDKSPAEKAGLKAGDIIVAMDGNKLSTMSGLKERLSIKKAGTNVTITVKRSNQNGEYKEKEFNVKLGKASDFQDALTENQTQNNGNNSQNQNGQDINPGNGSGNSGDYYYDDGNNGGNNGGENIDPFEFFFR